MLKKWLFFVVPVEGNTEEKVRGRWRLSVCGNLGHEVIFNKIAKMRKSFQYKIQAYFSQVSK